jgi:hypothetical protein
VAVLSTHVIMSFKSLMMCEYFYGGIRLNSYNIKQLNLIFIH